ncbi:hypothetical protein JZO70_05190 [Enterococcus sp. 669A]|uniref:Lipoprotein n=1 Tax=Candidatus Enterococcus moelleringii TaxID=2815325 RepID=A0ABS3L7F5_9ENTE|nr:hypothetical protein [Enterococcus sp. 669A]MBO1305543.1 hypothetical protein [Enterococcus sp. 669A]
MLGKKILVLGIALLGLGLVGCKNQESKTEETNATQQSAKGNYDEYIKTAKKYIEEEKYDRAIVSLEMAKEEKDTKEVNEYIEALDVLLAITTLMDQEDYQGVINNVHESKVLDKDSSLVGKQVKSNIRRSYRKRKEQHLFS